MDRRRFVTLTAACGAAGTTMLAPYQQALASTEHQSLTRGTSNNDVLLTKSDLDRIRRDVENRTDPVHSAYMLLVNETISDDLERAANMEEMPELFWVGPYYEVPPELRELAVRFRDDGIAAYRLALHHYITNDKESARAARKLILAWGDIEEFSTEDDTPLVWASQFPDFIFAASILRSS